MSEGVVGFSAIGLMFFILGIATGYVHLMSVGAICWDVAMVGWAVEKIEGYRRNKW